MLPDLMPSALTLPPPYLASQHLEAAPRPMPNCIMYTNREHRPGIFQHGYKDEEPGALRINPETGEVELEPLWCKAKDRVEISFQTLSLRRQLSFIFENDDNQGIDTLPSVLGFRPKHTPIGCGGS